MRKLTRSQTQVAAYAVIITFMVVTIGHVAIYTGDFEQEGYSFLGIPYALAVDASIIICSQLTRWKTQQRLAWTAYFLFIAASGVMNVAYVRPWERPSLWLQIGAWVYALFPTAAISMLGFLSRDVRLVSTVSDSKRSQVENERPEEPQVENEQPGEPQRKATINDWRSILASLNGSKRPRKTAGVQRLLTERGFEKARPSTARRWAAMARGERKEDA